MGRVRVRVRARVRVRVSVRVRVRVWVWVRVRVRVRGPRLAALAAGCCGAELQAADGRGVRLGPKQRCVGLAPATVCDVLQAATTARATGCNRTCYRLHPHVVRAATTCDVGCPNPDPNPQP